MKNGRGTYLQRLEILRTQLTQLKCGEPKSHLHDTWRTKSIIKHINLTYSATRTVNVYYGMKLSGESGTAKLVVIDIKPVSVKLLQ